MFKVGDLVIYEHQGVYAVKEISGSPVDKNDDRLFYVLVPQYEPACNIVVTPVTNPKVREIITREAATELIYRIPEIGALSVENERNRKDVYRAALGNLQLEDFVRIIKTVNARREDTQKNKKRLSETDVDYEKRAKHGLYSEFAAVFEVPLGDVEQMIADMIENVG